MKKLLLIVSLLIAVPIFAADEKSESASPLAPLAPFVGGLWVGTDVTAPKTSTPLQIELRFAWSENKQAIRFDSSFVKGDKRRPYTSGLYAWNGAKGQIAIVYADSSGSLTQGLISPVGTDTLVDDLTVTEAGGKTYPVQVRLTKISGDVFTNEILLQKDGAWIHLVTVRYERKA